MISLNVEINERKSISSKTNFKVQLFEGFVLGVPPSVQINEKKN